MALDISPTTQDALSVIIQNYNFNVGADAQINDVDYVLGGALQDPASLDPNDTIITATPVVVSTIRGKVTIRYRRMDLSGLPTTVPVNRTDFTLVSEIIDKINALHGITLVANDYEDATLPGVDGVMAVYIKPTSFLFTGQINIRLVTV